MVDTLRSLFAFNVSPWEIVLRGTATYLFLFALFRIAMRRNVGGLALADILVLVLVADAAQNMMAGAYDTIAEGALLVATLVGWNWLLDWLAFRFPRLQKILEPPVVTLVRNGRVVDPNLEKHLMTEDELRSKLRAHGVDKLSDVKAARLEGDGDVSVVLKDDAKASPVEPSAGRPL